MKRINKAATKTFLSLIDGLSAGEARRIDNAGGAFMAVSVDVLLVDGDSKLVALAHRYEQNGDLMPDPDVEFLVSSFGGETWVVPTAIDQAVGYRREVELDGLKVTGFRPRGQADLARFCNVWLRNIAEQQEVRAAA